MEDDVRGRVPDGPQIKAETWFSLALAASIIAMCIFVFVAAWVFSGDVREMPPRAQAFTPFGAALIAVVTFCTIAWRGVLNTKQLEYQAAQIAHQAEQLAQTRRQNDAKDEENLAKLLMDGTKLLGEDKPSHVLAGVAALQAVVVSPKGAFASQAMDILVDLIEETYEPREKAKVFDAAREAVGVGARGGKSSSRNLRLIFSGEKKRYAYGIRGVRSLFYKNAYIDDVQFPIIAEVGQYRFEESHLEEVAVEKGSRRFKGCHFTGCDIRELSHMFLKNNTFESCDFSGAVFRGSAPGLGGNGEHPYGHLRSGGNFYDSDRPITGSRRVDWDAVLDRIEPVNVEQFDEVEENGI